MKNLLNKLGFAIYLLLITNIWIQLFNSLIIILNSFFPPEVKEVFITQPGPAEQFEIPVYILLSLFFILFIIFTHRLTKKLDELPVNLKIVTFIILVVFFALALGSFPLNNQYDPYPPRHDGTIYFVTAGLYILISGLIIILSRTF